MKYTKQQRKDLHKAFKAAQLYWQPTSATPSTELGTKE